MDWEAASPEDRFKEAERRIEVAHHTGATYLDLGDLGLSELPEDLGQLGDLRELFIGQHFRDKTGVIAWDHTRPDLGIPDFGPITTLLNLRCLYLGSCPALDGDLGPLAQLSNLQFLSLDSCVALVGDLTPLAQLSNLQFLSLDSCHTLAGHLASLTELSNLQHLSLKYSPFLTGDLVSLSGLSKLQNLSLQYCLNLTGDLNSFVALSSLQDLSLTFGPHLTGDLASLGGLTSLQNLSLKFFPNLTGDLTAFADLSNLQKLDLSSCRTLTGDLTPLAKLSNIQNLSISYCEGLAGAAAPLVRLTKLRELTIFNLEEIDFSLAHCQGILASNPDLNELCCNSVNSIPSEVLSQSLGDDCLPRLRSYLAERAAGEAEETDVKLILLGNGQVGKTQLCRRLRDEKFEANSKSTHGVKLSRQPLTLRKNGVESTVFANWWDFGGQDIYHSTHSLFLRSRAVFLILWTPLLENTDEFAENGIPLRNQPLQYWLDYVRSLAGADSPIIVIQSQCESFAAKREPPARAEGFQFAEYCEFGAANDHRRETLEGLIHDAIRYLREKTGNLVIGKGRAELRRRLYEMRIADELRPLHEERLYQTLDRTAFEILCQEVGGISSPEHALDYFHRTGVVFHQKGLFDDRIVLDQSWALDAIYAVFDRARAMPALQRNGRFTRRDLEMLCWEGKSREEQCLFLGLMQSCGICFIHRRTDDDEHTYLAPDLLPKYDQIEMNLFSWKEEEADATLRLEYRFLHQALLRSLISRIGTDARDNAVYWKYGVWLRTRSGTQLLIRQENTPTESAPARGCLCIAAQGPDWIHLIDKVREVLRDIRVLEKPEETLQLGGDTVSRRAIDTPIDGKVRTVDGRAVDARPFISFWSEIRKGPLEIPEETKFMIDAAPLEKKPLKVFYSYAHEDEKYRDELAKHLKPLEREKLLETWHDRAIEAGVEWDEEIRLKLHEADIILLLVSIDFLASDYIWAKELAPALRRHEDKLARVIPIILRTCEWGSAPFSKLQALPRGAKAVSTWSDRDEAYTSISKALRELANKRA